MGVLLGQAGSDTAHAQEAENSLQSISPEDGAQLDVSPDEIVLVFNEEIGDDDEPGVLLGCSLAAQQVGEPDIDRDRLIVTFPIPDPLPRGACTLEWFLRDADGATIASDSTSFTVLSDPPATAAETTDDETDTTEFDTVPAVPTQTSVVEQETAGSTEGAVWLGRMLSTLAILVIFGSLALISVGWPEGPEYIVTVRFLRLVWIVGLVGTILYVVGFAADTAGGAFADGLSPSAWLDLSDAGWPGRAALARLVLVGACGWVVARPERIIDPTTAMWAWLIPGAAAITVALTRSDGPAPVIGFLVGIVHVLAAAVWFGGAVLVARVILAGPGEDDLVQATKAFSKVSVPAMLVTAVTGVIQMVRLDGGDLFSSSHGRVVLLKAVAVAAMLAVGLAARQQVQMRLARTTELNAGVADRFRRAFTAEAAIGVVVLMLSGWLVSQTPAKADPLAGERYLPAIAFNDPTSGLQAQVSVGPGIVGRNGIKVDIDAPDGGISNLVVGLVPPEGSPPCDVANETGGCKVLQPVALTGPGTAVLLTDIGVPLMVPGTWTLELSAATQQGVMQDVAGGTFVVRDEDGTIPTAPTTVPDAGPTVGVTVIDSVPETAPLVTPPPTEPPGTTDPEEEGDESDDE